MGPTGATLQEYRHRYTCSITVCPRSHWHPNATDILGRTVVVRASQPHLRGVFRDLFSQVEAKFGPQFAAQFMLVIPAAAAGRMIRLEGSRIRTWEDSCRVHQQLSQRPRAPLGRIWLHFNARIFPIVLSQHGAV